MRKILIFATYLLLVSFLVSSCKTRKNNRSKNINTLTVEQIYDSVYKFQYDYTTLYAKCNVKFSDNQKKYALKGNLRIQKDSLIWISLSIGLGIEAMRLECTKDSVFLIDKINKSFTKGKYDFLKKLFKIDVDYNSLESILTNQFFIYPTVADEKLDFSKQFSLKNDSNQIIAYRKTDESVENLLRFNNSDFRISSYLINDVPNVRSLKIDYEKGEFDEAKNFPSKVDIASVNAGKNILLNVNYTKVSLNTDLTFPFRVPDSYKVIDR
jgi:hypothetical protein